MIRLFAMAAIFMSLPLSVEAAAIGFSGEPVWLSNTPVIEGETVLVHAALTNGAEQPLTGTLIFRADGTSIGSVPINLKAEEARVVSVSWTPKSGTYELAVELANPSVPSAKRTETLKVSVASREATRSAAASALGVQSLSSNPQFTDSSSIQTAIAGVSADVGAVVAPGFIAVDSWRKSGSDFLNTKSAAAKAEVSALSDKKAALKEADTPEAKKESRNLTLWQMVRTLLLYIYQALNLLVSKAGVFYPVVAFGFFFFLWKMWQRFRRPSYDY